MKLHYILGLGALCASAPAQTVWYNGDDNSVDSLVAMKGTPNGYFNQQWMEFDDFQWNSASNARSVMASTTANKAYTTLFWEIRSGMTSSSQGSLVASGTSSVNLVDLGLWSINNGFNLERYDMTADIGSVALTNGATYWLGMAFGVTDANFVGAITTTAGANGIGSTVNNANRIYREDTTPLYGQDSINLSMGISASGVPEPTTIAALGLGILALRRKARKA